MLHRGLSPLYLSCVMCAPSRRDAVIAAVPVPFTDRVGPDTHSSCIYLQFPLIWFDLRSKPVVIKRDLVCKIQRVVGRGLKSKVNRGRLPWRWGVRMAGPGRETWHAVVWVFVMRMEASSGLPASCLLDFLKKKICGQKNKNADIWLTYCWHWAASPSRKKSCIQTIKSKCVWWNIAD